MRLLVTGASGLLGLNLCLVASQQGHAVTGLVHSRGLRNAPFEVRQVDLLDMDRTLDVIEASEPEAIIHCAAVASINAAEKAPDLSLRLNGAVPGELAGAAACWKVPFLHISSDAVFDGQQGGYTETDPTQPLSIYARTKLTGEQAVLAANPDALIARTVFYGWSLSGKRSLGEFFYNALREGSPINGFEDVFFCPLYVETLAETLLEMLTAELTGIYHVVGSESLSKFEFGQRIAHRFGLDPELISPIRGAGLDRGAPRSSNLTLSNEKLQKDLGHSLPNVDEGLDLFYQRWQEGYPQALQQMAV
jgi:dTDP-4-dehydrorhamnose reductase